MGRVVTPTVRLDPNNCGLAYIDGFGYGSRNPFSVETNAKELPEFEKLMKEFETDEGRFRNTGEGPYECPTRRALMASLTTYQKSLWLATLTKHGWKEVAAFCNTKLTGTGAVFIFFKVHPEGTIENPIFQKEGEPQYCDCGDPECDFND